MSPTEQNRMQASPPSKESVLDLEARAEKGHSTQVPSTWHHSWGPVRVLVWCPAFRLCMHQNYRKARSHDPGSVCQPNSKQGLRFQRRKQVYDSLCLKPVWYVWTCSIFSIFGREQSGIEIVNYSLSIVHDTIVFLPVSEGLCVAEPVV